MVAARPWTPFPSAPKIGGLTRSPSAWTTCFSDHYAVSLVSHCCSSTSTASSSLFGFYADRRPLGGSAHRRRSPSALVPSGGCAAPLGAAIRVRLVHRLGGTRERASPVAPGPTPGLSALPLGRFRAGPRGCRPLEDGRDRAVRRRRPLAWIDDASTTPAGPGPRHAPRPTTARWALRPRGRAG